MLELGQRNEGFHKSLVGGLSMSVMSDSLGPHESQHARLSYRSPIARVHSDSCPSSR